MNKTYLLMAGSHYYPQAGTMDWAGCFSTYKEAISCVKAVRKPLEVFTRGPRKGQPKPNQVEKTEPSYLVYFPSIGEHRTCDWYEIIDLASWINETYDNR